MLPLRTQARPLIWGAVAAAVGAAIVFASQTLGTRQTANPLLQNPATAGAVTFFFGWAAANVRNWYGSRLLGKLTKRVHPQGKGVLNTRVGGLSANNRPASPDAAPGVSQPGQQIVRQIPPPRSGQ